VRRTALLAALLLAFALPSAVAVGQSTTTDRQTRPGATTPSNQSRIGGRSGFGRRTTRPRVTRSRPARPSRRRQTRRPLFGSGFFGSVLRFLGIAYLVNLLFGWGPGGGSPLGLLIVLGVILWLASRRRRRPPLYY
jgi:hypothetical protein